MPIRDSASSIVAKLKSKKPKWTDPEQSCGVKHRQMGPSSWCWEAKGPAREMFVHLAKDINLYLENHGKDLDHLVTWSIYMIGREEKTSEPVIMFCGNESSRKRMRKTVEESGVLKRYPGVRSGDASQPPDFDQLVPLSGITFQSLSLGHLNPIANSRYIQNLKESMTRNELAFVEKREDQFGTQLAIPHYDGGPSLQSVHLATLGGILRSGEGEYMYVTAAHVFDVAMDPPNLYGIKDNNSHFEFDIGESSGSEDGRDSPDVTSRGSLTPELVPSRSSECETASVDVLDDFPELSEESSPGEELRDDISSALRDDTGGEGKGMEISLLNEAILAGRRLGPSEGKSHTSLDYALIQIDPSFRNLQHYPLQYAQLQYPPHTLSLYPKAIATAPHDANVFSVTGSMSLLNGTISGTPSYMAIPGNNKIQELWTVKFNGSLMKGDCGSWVIDELNRELFGHIIAGSPDSGAAYIVPTYQLVQDAKSTYGLELELCTIPASSNSQPYSHFAAYSEPKDREIEDLSIRGHNGSIQSATYLSTPYVRRDPALESQRLHDFVADDPPFNMRRLSVAASRRLMAQQIKAFDLAFSRG